MAANNIQLNLILKAVDGMSVVVKSACYQSDSAFEKMNRSLEDTAGKFETAGKKAAVFGGAVLAASAVNLKTAGDFEAQMNNVSTLIDTNSENLKNMGNEVLKIGQNSPKALSDLTEGLYSIRSAGIEANQQFRVLSGSQMLSVAGLSTTAEAVDLATSAINAFNLKGREADGIYDMFFKVVKYGKTNISEFAQGFGGTAGVVASANIQLDEYSAAVAALTTSGLKASIAHTQLKAAIAGLSRGSKEQMAVFQKYGVKSFSQLVEVSGGMVNAFNRINRAVGGNQARLINLLGSVEAYNAVLSLTGANNKTYLQTLSDMRSGVDSLSEAYEKQTDGLNNRLLIMKNQAQILSIKLGTGLIPVVKAAGGAFAHLNSILDKIPDGFVNFISITGAGVGALSLLGGTGLMVAGSMIRNFILLRNVMRAASILSWAYPAILPLAGVALAVAAVGGAVVFAYNKFEGFRNHLKATWALVKLGGASLALLGNSFMNGALKVWGFISPAVRVAGVILSWVTPIGLAFRAIKGLSDIIGGLISKAGGLRTIGVNIANWADKKTKDINEVNASVKNQRTSARGKSGANANGDKNRGVDGSHAKGLDFVPYDGYIAELHQGETVLNKDEADYYRNSYVENNRSNNYLNNYSKNLQSGLVIEFKPVINIPENVPQNIKDIVLEVLRRAKGELLDEILALLERRKVRVY